ncbi:MAG: molybdopterin molybdotransferase MoeA [Rhodoferax sp.]|nr:molybdopterin molybdotransferase MoeA [Rhodoferax sp.]
MKTLAQIAAELQGYEPQALPAHTVNAFLAQMVPLPREAEDVPLMQALGRVLAAPVISPIDVPAHDNSAMDGYAFCGQALQPDQPLALKLVGTALAGEAYRGAVAPGQCIRIMTGAVMPAGLDTVVPQEMAVVDGTQITIPPGAVRNGDNRRARGEDLQQGTVALAKGSVLAPASLGLLASLGLPQVRVWRRLRVAYFSTGDEILSLGEPVREGAVFDSNRYTVWGMLQRMGVECVDLGVVPDEPAQLEAAFRLAAARADAIITSGGVSVGEADHTKAMMRKIAQSDTPGEGGVVFWRIAMRPGRPMAVGRVGRIPLFGLPGNPVAVMVTFLAFVRPALWQMMGANPDDPAVAPPLLKARSTVAVRKKAGRTEYQRAIVSVDAAGQLGVQTTGDQGSGVLRSMVRANGLLVLHHEQGNVAPGDLVDVMVFAGVL